MSRGRTAASEPDVEDRETWEWTVLMFQQITTVVQDWCFNSRGGSDTGPNKMSARTSASPPFMQSLHSSAPALP